MLCTSLCYRNLDKGLWLFYSPSESVSLSDWLLYQCQWQTWSRGHLLWVLCFCHLLHVALQSRLCRPLCMLSRYHRTAAISPENNFVLLEDNCCIFLCGNNFEEVLALLSFGPFWDKEDGSHSEQQHLEVFIVLLWGWFITKGWHH